MRRAPAVRLATAATFAVVSAVACVQLIGVEGIPGEAGRDAAPDQRTMGRDAGDAARDSQTGADVRPQGCEAGTMQCSADGLGVELCINGRWGPREACPEPTPVCLGSGCTCEPGAGQCTGPYSQQWQHCQAASDGAPPTWVSIGGACPGTCTLTGCAGEPASCAGADAGTSTCGPDAGETCCKSIEVPGGAFYRSATDFSHHYPATVSAFRLDRFEVSVLRFARFLQALAGGGDGGAEAGVPPWRPLAGSGKHAHLNSGQGLVSSSGGYEAGWSSSWDSQLDYSFVNHQLSTCVDPGLVTYDPATMKYAANFGWSSPINCVTWAQAYAFCIWDGGFLPSEAEWNYVAAGGGAELEYPWSGTTDAGPLGIGCDEAVYVSATAQCSPYVMPVGSTSPQGDGLWGQADLAGNVLEWALDLYTSPYPGDCHDCASLPLPGSDAGVALRVQRGGSFVSSAAEVTASARGFSPEALASYAGGFRCARPP